jgi:hypothetical protein
MGTDYDAYAVIGCEVTGKLYDEVKERGCRCPSPMDAGAKFCAHCGDLAWKAKMVARPYFNSFESTIGTMSVSFTTDNERAFAGFRSKVNETKTADFWPVPNPANFFDAVKSELEHFGLWDPSSFGLWCVMRCSY